MELHPIFKISEETSNELLQLLNSVTLGTNGAQYRHLNTNSRIQEADNPVHLYMERNGKVLGNMTMCRREGGSWYIRYFAFDPGIQSSGKKRTGKAKGLLKEQLKLFFLNTLSGDENLGQASSFYAYIDPANEKSLWMSENFGFQQVGNIATQSFSRVNPQRQNRIRKIEDWKRIEPIILKVFSDYNYFYLTHTAKPPFYILENEIGDPVGCAKISTCSWEIKRLPGKFGGVLTKLIPFIPGLRRLIKPKKHTFIVPEAVWVSENNSKLLLQLFEGILYEENQNLILWWVDEKDKLYSSSRNEIKWGLLHKLIGVNKAVVVRKSKDNESFDSSIPVYTSGWDFI